MAAYDRSDNSIEDAAPHELLEAIRRYADRTTVLCQAGGVHVPSTYRKLTVFAEEMVVEVVPPPGRTFHPKIWLLRFTNAAGELIHRLVCMSRNLTGDRSWDTVLTADEDAAAPHQMAASPVSTFLTELLDMSVRPVGAERAAQIRDLAATARARSFAVPAPFTSGELHPLGTRGGRSWPMPAASDRNLVISPFLDVTTARSLPRGTTLVSRAEAFDRLGSSALQGLDLRVLQPYADAPPEAIDEASSDSASTPAMLEVRTGLHAKILAWDTGTTGNVLTGSANATSAAFGGNIEFGVLLSGPVGTCGAAAILREGKDPGLSRLLQPHTPSEEPVPDPGYDLEREVEAFHVALAEAGPELRVTVDGDGFLVTLAWADLPQLIGESQVRPVTLTPAFNRPLGHDNRWRGRGMSDLTTFLAVSTRLERGGVIVERATALSALLVGAPDDRASRVLRELLNRIEDVLRYLALLLKDPGLDDMVSSLLEETTHEGASTTPRSSEWQDDLVLLEPLVRAFARGDDSLARVERLLDDLRDDDGNLPDLGHDFDALWQVFSDTGAP